MGPNQNIANQPAQPVRPVDNGGDIVFRNAEKKNTGMVVGMVILALLAAGGIGFGVWAYLSGNQKEAKLNEQIAGLQSQVAEQQVEIADEEDDEEVVDGEDVNTADYIYVGEWNLKIKVPEDWRNLISNYAYYNDYPQAVDTLAIKEKSASELANALLSYYGEQPCDTVETNRGMCLNIDDRYYLVDFNASCSEAFINYFMDKNNYSKI